jgi:membrane associated rhomboid family serine protease
VIILFPVGVEDAEVNRLPWVSISIAALCFLAFLGSWVIPAHPQGPEPGEVVEVVQYWRSHPYLKLPESFQARFIPKQLPGYLKAKAVQQPADEELVRKEQAQLDDMVAALIAASERSTLHRFSLIPARGMSQIGWLTHMFLHIGWLHLLGNLFFFYLVGPLLEDIWGRPLFAGFYILGGLAAAFAQYLLEPSSPVMMAGASGAIAACMGAFALRFALRKIRIAYFVWIYSRMWRGTTLWSAWVCGLLWLLNEVWNFWWTGSNSGVAVMAHMGGFAFGAAIAFGLRASSIESKYIAPKVEATFTWTHHPAIQKATAALEAKELPAAASAFREVLAAQPTNLEAQFGLARVALLENRVSDATRSLEPHLSRLITRGDQEKALPWLEELLPLLDPKELPPIFAYKIAQLTDGGPAGLRASSERFFARAGENGGVLGAKALIRAAGIALNSASGAEAALHYLTGAQAIPNLPEECKLQLSRLQLEMQGKLPPVELPQTLPASPFDASPGAAPNPAAAPVIVSCSLKRMDENGLEIEVQSRRARLGWKRLLAIGVGVIPGAANGGQKNLVMTDLVVSPNKAGGPATVLRIPGGALGLDSLFPGLHPREALTKLIRELLARSGARPLPNRDALSSGNYPRFASVSKLDAAFHGSPLGARMRQLASESLATADPELVQKAEVTSLVSPKIV